MQLVARGASDYFALPDDLEIFRTAVAAAVSGGRTRGPTAAAGREDAFAAIVGESDAIKKVLARAARLLPHRNASVLILGETGTGKELLARALHAGGPRRDGPFVAINCSALPEHLIESELFGHERGSFTDAHAAKPGLFEVAHAGTLFLDEIGDLPLALQAKLLRALEDKEIRRVGGTKSRTVDVRIVAATNDQLSDRVQEGSFREDLFFRLSTVMLDLPPLRERGDDLFLIAQALLAQLAREHGLAAPPLTADLHPRLRAHPWPGNIRELKNALERALLLSPPGELSADELLPPAAPRVRRDGPIPFPAPLLTITTAAAQATVQLCGGNRSEEPRRVGIAPRRLRRLLDAGGERGRAPGLRGGHVEQGGWGGGRRRGRWGWGQRRRRLLLDCPCGNDQTDRRAGGRHYRTRPGPVDHPARRAQRGGDDSGEDSGRVFRELHPVQARWSRLPATRIAEDELLELQPGQRDAAQGRPGHRRAADHPVRAVHERPGRPHGHRPAPALLQLCRRLVTLGIQERTQGIQPSGS